MPPQTKTDPADDEFGLEGFRSLAHVKLQWRGKGPRGWAETVGRITKLRGLVVRCMRDRESQRARD